jgi:hypothetical protein
VNAQPLSPPIFEKIAPDLKNNNFYYIGSLRLRFFILLNIFGNISFGNQFAIGSIF